MSILKQQLSIWQVIGHLTLFKKKEQQNGFFSASKSNNAFYPLVAESLWVEKCWNRIAEWLEELRV